MVRILQQRCISRKDKSSVPLKEIYNKSEPQPTCAMSWHIWQLMTIHTVSKHQMKQHAVIICICTLQSLSDLWPLIDVNKLQSCSSKCRSKYQKMKSWNKGLKLKYSYLIHLVTVTWISNNLVHTLKCMKWLMYRNSL